MKISVIYVLQRLPAALIYAEDARVVHERFTCSFWLACDDLLVACKMYVCLTRQCQCVSVTGGASLS